MGGADPDNLDRVDEATREGSVRRSLEAVSRLTIAVARGADAGREADGRRGKAPLAAAPLQAARTRKTAWALARLSALPLQVAKAGCWRARP